ncbi:CRISPR-associated helicase Cas3 family protein [Salinisphaera shabanensis E1L3A]|uniref:CRISPR-associated helicase Cas3 family protein n=1 Tax=Salinisphaera shabanensis E1L3A TaxID=1033802 RepID=U2EIZ8_9GAMM|nr:CRISPR-associated helicase/endonuclease Cas3 [Salinisphaera shabanensis]ERJ18000.1 CRISPR-associated helicase Cas3 family protein [Salinisphaera shabanensis E1L3A]
MFYAHSTECSDARDWQGLADHLQAVADLAAKRAARFGWENAGRAAGLLHDLGKYSPAFQRRLSGSGERVDHSTAGALEAKTRFPDGLGHLLAYAIAGHHAGLANGRDAGTRTPLSDRLVADLPTLSSRWREELVLPDSLHPDGAFHQRRDRPFFQMAFLTRMLFSCLVDADFIETETFYTVVAGDAPPERGNPTSLSTLRDALNTHLDELAAKARKSPVNERRADILHHVRAAAPEPPGHFSLTVPTGGGKTLASLAFALDHAIAHGMDRVIYVIPFTSIVEQNAAVFRDALGAFGEDAVLEHHSAFDDDSRRGRQDRHSRDKLKRASENWDMPIVVTTAVQFFESLFAAKTSKARKLHNIANSVVVLDEAQTMPLALLRPSVAALDELALNYRASIVLCTATQPALEETDNPAHSFAGGLRDVRELAPDPHSLAQQFERVTVRHIGTLDDDGLTEELLDCEQVLCIVNNRRHARALYESIADSPGAYHLTTAMCAVHRRQILAEIREVLASGSPCRVVSTSLIEAGVDIDFPRVLRAEAGLDSIAQAAGRCNREGRRESDQSEVRIFATANQDWAPPPELKQFAQATRAVLRAHGEAPLAPAAITAYFRLLYWQKGPQELDKHDLLGQIETAQLDGLPFDMLEQKYRLIENTQRSVIIPYDDRARRAIADLSHAERVGGIARTLQPYTVQVPIKGFHALEQAGVIAAIEPDRFGDQFVLLIDEHPSELNTNSYDPNMGLNWSDPTYRSAESNLW